MYTPNNNLQKVHDEVEKYEFLFEKLRKETSINDIEEVIHLFRTIEENNNDLYR
jgi:hypothetical protein